MILWFGIAQIIVAALAAVTCIWQFARGRGPNDYTLGATLLMGLLLVAQVIVAIVAPATGNAPVGDSIEFWMYLIVAVLLPFGAGFWALVTRTRPANLVLALVNLSVGIMLYRMFVIWG